MYGVHVLQLLMYVRVHAHAVVHFTSFARILRCWMQGFIHWVWHDGRLMMERPFVCVPWVAACNLHAIWHCRQTDITMNNQMVR